MHCSGTVSRILGRLSFGRGVSVVSRTKQMFAVGPNLTREAGLQVREWAEKHEVVLPDRVLWDQFGRMDSSKYNNNPHKFLGASVFSAILTDLLFNSLSDQSCNPFHIKALEVTLLSKRELFLRGDALGMVPLLRYQLPFKPNSSYKPEAPTALAIIGILGALHQFHGTNCAKKFISSYIVPIIPKTRAELELIMNAKSITLLEEVTALSKADLYFKLLSKEGSDVIEVGAYDGIYRIGKGEGSSVEEAKQQAAKDALGNRKVFPKFDAMTPLEY